MARQEDELDFTSGRFNPARALATPDAPLPDPEAETFEDLYRFREAVHGQRLNVEQEIPGVLGPGGIPRPQVRQVPADRQFTPEQGLLRGRGRRRARNVITRMDEMTGPLALLRQCRDNNTRVKVYTRNHSEVRGVLTGFVVAFDKHWNLALRDVDEVFQKKISCKAPVFGDISKFVRVGDLSIQSDIKEDTDTSSDDDEMGGRYARKGERPAAGATGGGGGRGRGREDRSEEECRWLMIQDAVEAAARMSMEVDYTKPGTSEAQDARRLILAQGTQNWKDNGAKRKKKDGKVDEDENKGAKKKEGKKMLQLEEKEEEENVEEGEAKKRVRKRKKREIRKRHVNQLLVRGENVVLIAVMRP
ncbi:U7 snRNA-associated Sm-like protein LSm11 [Eriocheir sinensis]|uniref:U7 snRNA-associated Sm-like protein LSm11 n=1 Tax=Eriocheir sinensis TaxID=95602 RepID=UPI0021CA098F|nr:U7 snRNA-associated Sm-like protein LSm11 [Eriocheir sinensis]